MQCTYMHVKGDMHDACSNSHIVNGNNHKKSYACSPQSRRRAAIMFVNRTWQLCILVILALSNNSQTTFFLFYVNPADPEQDPHLLRSKQRLSVAAIH